MIWMMVCWVILGYKIENFCDIVITKSKNSSEVSNNHDD